jgi:acyl-CoA synthetase (NDP forming)
MLDEAGSKARLAAAGVAVPKGVVVRDCAFQAASALGEQLALKALGLAHKSEHGAVRLNLTQADLSGVARDMGTAGLFLVEDMVQDTVAELLVGLRRDPVYGATLTVGLGGVTAELLDDTVTLVLPVSAEQVHAALGRLRLAALLTGYRGRKPADIDAAVSAILAMADLLENDLGIDEIEVNPLMLRAVGHGAVAADAVIWIRVGK